MQSPLEFILSKRPLETDRTHVAKRGRTKKSTAASTKACSIIVECSTIHFGLKIETLELRAEAIHTRLIWFVALLEPAICNKTTQSPLWTFGDFKGI